MIDILNLALPYFGLIFIGYACGKYKRLPEAGLEWMNFFLLYVSLPALFFRVLAKTPFEELNNPPFVIATTLATEPELMLLDEPTQGMGHEDVDRVTQLIKKVSANRTILMVEHNMNVVSSIADTISVLQRGQVIAEGDYATVSANPQVLEAYMGSADAALQGAH